MISSGRDPEPIEIGPVDRGALGREVTLAERGVNLERMRRERLAKVQEQMRRHDLGAVLLTDAVNIRYSTGLAVMSLWMSTNLAHYVLIPAEGPPVVFEYPQALFRANAFYDDVRPTRYWQARFTEHLAAEYSEVWAAELADQLRQWGIADAPVGIDVLDFHGFKALTDQRLKLADADLALERARQIKTRDEIEVIKQSAAVCEAALWELEQAIRPGISENELVATFWGALLRLGGEYCFTRLIETGAKTNPWFQEAGSKIVRPGDLVGVDTDMIGPEGYVCDMSRTFVCGNRASAAQREAYRVAYDFVAGTVPLLQPGTSFEDLARNAPKIPEPYRAQRYPVISHGIGTDDEPPFVPFPDTPGAVMPEGEFEVGMVVTAECYAGKVGAQDGVKLEDVVLITEDGPSVLTVYPFDDTLLSRS